MTKKINTGIDERTGLYKSRYYAKKNARSDQVVVKVDGGYTIKDYRDYDIWRNQK